MTKLTRQIVKAQKASIRSKKAVKVRKHSYSGLDIVKVSVIDSDADVSKVSIYEIKRRRGMLNRALIAKARMDKRMSDNKDKVNKNKNEFLEERLEAIWTPHMTSESPELTKSVAKNMKANIEKHKDYYASLKTNPRKP